MSPVVVELGAQYVSGLQIYVLTGDEVSLSGAYELGRRAIALGFGVLDMAALHRLAVEHVVLTATDTERDKAAEAAAGYFNELLAPFEMSFRGYRTANEQLQSLNSWLRQQKDAVESANRELESFSHSVSHDLRNPLGRITGFSELLLERYAGGLDEQSKSYLSFIHSSAQEMLRLIADLLNLARVTRTEMQRRDVDMSALAEKVLAGFQGFAPERQVDIRIESGVHANGDPTLLGVVMENLLSNAWKFTSKRTDAKIEFGTELRTGRTVYFVRDNGAGFDMARAGKLFETFSRLHSTREFEGTGVGLATVQRVVHRHDGDIWAHGEVGVGATFYFTLEGGRRP